MITVLSIYLISGLVVLLDILSDVKLFEASDRAVDEDWKRRGKTPPLSGPAFAAAIIFIPVINTIIALIFIRDFIRFRLM